MKIYVYIHICCANSWKEIFISLIDMIKHSDLYSKVDEIRCSILGNYEISLFDDPKIKIVNHSNNLELYEVFTLEKIYKDCKKENFKFLYLHTKGIRFNGKSIYVNDWIEYMCYFNIYLNQKCIDLLNDNDSVGVNLIDIPVLHYSGNFWWSKSSYIRKLDKCKHEHYCSAEFWLTEKRIGKYISLHNSNVCHYFQRYTPNNYK